VRPNFEKAQQLLHFYMQRTVSTAICKAKETHSLVWIRKSKQVLRIYYLEIKKGTTVKIARNSWPLRRSLKHHWPFALSMYCSNTSKGSMWLVNMDDTALSSISTYLHVSPKHCKQRDEMRPDQESWRVRTKDKLTRTRWCWVTTVCRKDSAIGKAGMWGFVIPTCVLFLDWPSVLQMAVKGLRSAMAVTLARFTSRWRVHNGWRWTTGQ